MKPFNSFLLSGFAVLILASCSHDVSMETVVHENGELDKTIVLETDSGSTNMLGISQKTGWKQTILQRETQTDSEKDSTITILYQKTFSSQDEANAELASPSDTLFRVTSTYEKKFRWFYTYLYYADTYQAVNRMSFPPDDYITQEDYAFITRLPAEGKKISKADSLYLSELNEKLFDVYGMRALYEDYYELSLKMIRENNLDIRWIDSLSKHKENIYKMLISKKDLEDDFLIHVMDSIGIPLPYEKLIKSYPELTKQLDRKVNFITHANDGKYQHKIDMPWTLVRTNADSVAGKQFFWSPPSIKFLLKDYTMYVETRQLNYWSIIVLVALVGFTVYVFVRKKGDS